MKKNHNSFVVADSSKCIGCKACEVACFAVHNSKNNVGYTVGTVTTPIIPRLNLVRTPEVTAPVQCRHCEDAPCAASCIHGAIVQIDNTIVIREEKCIGCKNCIIACPFGAIDLRPEYKDGEKVTQLNLSEKSGEKSECADKITAYKCDLCIECGNPACVEACPVKALKLVDPSEDKKEKNRLAAAGLKILNNSF